MTTYRLYSWNVNGIRSSVRNGMLEWMKTQKIDYLGLQEIKAMPDQVDETVITPKGLKSAWHSAEKKGYSGVLAYYKSKYKPIVETSIGVEEFDREGRVIITKFDEFTVLNCYFPNGKKDDDRLDYKMRFYDRFLKVALKLRKNGEKVIFCGDVNTAHKEIDLTNPKPNSKISGFLPKERAWIDKVIKNGFVDTLRNIRGDEEGLYTWWSQRARRAGVTAKERNVGWRLDYFFIDKSLLPNLKNAEIHRSVDLSDHCPVSITLEF